MWNDYSDILGALYSVYKDKFYSKIPQFSQML